MVLMSNGVRGGFVKGIIALSTLAAALALTAWYWTAALPRSIGVLLLIVLFGYAIWNLVLDEEDRVSLATMIQRAAAPVPFC